MKVQFHIDKQLQPQSEDGVKVVYGKAKRTGYRIRWYFLLALVISPIIVMSYFLYREHLMVIAPGLITSTPLTLTANDDGVVGAIDVKVGNTLDAYTQITRITNQAISDEINYIEQALESLPDTTSADFSVYIQAIEDAQTSLNSIEEITQRYHAHRKNGKVSDSDYAAVINANTAAQMELASRKIALEEARRLHFERQKAGAISTARRALEKELVVKHAKFAALNVTTPYRARIVDVRAIEGERVNKGDPILTIARDQKPHVIAFLKPKFIERAKVGAKASIEFADGQSYSATVSEEVELVSKLPVQLAKPFEGQPAFLKVRLDIDDDLPRSRWVEGNTVEINFASLALGF